MTTLAAARAERDARIVAMALVGARRIEIARALGVTESVVDGVNRRKGLRFAQPTLDEKRASAASARSGLSDLPHVDVPRWVPKALRDDYRDRARTYGEEAAASFARAMKRDMERAMA